MIILIGTLDKNENGDFILPVKMLKDFVNIKKIDSYTIKVEGNEIVIRLFDKEGKPVYINFKKPIKKKLKGVKNGAKRTATRNG